MTPLQDKTQEAFDRLHKKSCHISFIYPNGWLWNIQCDTLEDDFTGDTIAEAIEKMEVYLDNQK